MQSSHCLRRFQLICRKCFDKHGLPFAFSLTAKIHAKRSLALLCTKKDEIRRGFEVGGTCEFDKRIDGWQRTKEIPRDSYKGYLILHMHWKLCMLFRLFFQHLISIKHHGETYKNMITIFASVETSNQAILKHRNYQLMKGKIINQTTNKTRNGSRYGHFHHAYSPALYSSYILYAFPAQMRSFLVVFNFIIYLTLQNLNGNLNLNVRIPLFDFQSCWSILTQLLMEYKSILSQNPLRVSLSQSPDLYYIYFLMYSCSEYRRFPLMSFHYDQLISSLFWKIQQNLSNRKGVNMMRQALYSKSNIDAHMKYIANVEKVYRSLVNMQQKISHIMFGNAPVPKLQTDFEQLILYMISQISQISVARLMRPSLNPFYLFCKGMNKQDEDQFDQQYFQYKQTYAQFAQNGDNKEIERSNYAVLTQTSLYQSWDAQISMPHTPLEQ